MKTSTRWLLYSVVRLGLFAGVFALLMVLLGESLWWLSALFAMAISFAVSYLFLRDTRDELARDLQERRERPMDDPDADAENAANDAAVDGAAAGSPTLDQTTAGGAGTAAAASDEAVGDETVGDRHDR